MLDTRAIARSLTDANLTPAQADAITNGILQSHEQSGSDHATKADVAMLRVEMAALETRLIKWTIGTGVAVAGIVVAALRLLQ